MRHPQRWVKIASKLLSFAATRYVLVGLADVTRTLAIVKPDAMAHADTIKDVALTHGFKVLAYSNLRISQESAAQFYAEHQEVPLANCP